MGVRKGRSLGATKQKCMDTPISFQSGLVNSIVCKAHPQVSIWLCPTTNFSNPAHHSARCWSPWTRWITIQDGVLLRCKFSGCVCPFLPQIISFSHCLPCVTPNKWLHLRHYPINEPSNPSKLAHHWVLFFRVSKEWRKLALLFFLPVLLRSIDIYIRWAALIVWQHIFCEIIIIPLA